MSYSIIRMQKMKSTAIKGIQFHNQRERESETNPDINKDDSHLNYDLINGQQQIDYTEKINKLIEENVTTGKAIRKDAVRLAEFLITSDKEFFEKISPQEQKRYFETAHEFLAERYGEKNLIYATVHNDEKTPHMHVGFVPVTEDGRLSAKDFFGQKKQLVSLQDDFNEHLKQNGFELERGISSSRKHLETAKYKAQTFYNMEKEAQEKYELTMSRIQEIDEKSQSISNIEAKKVLGLVGMKEQDYNTLVDFAKNGVLYQSQAEELKNELDKTKKEVVQLKSDLQIGQEKIRHYYKDVETNLDTLADKKAVEKIKKSDFMKNYESLVEKYNSLAQKYNGLLDEKQELKKQVSTLTFENRSYQNENRVLKAENGKLKENLLKITKDFSAFKEKVGKVLHAQIDRFKTFLRVRDVEPSHIKALDDRRDKLVQDSMKKLEQPQKEMGLER